MTFGEALRDARRDSGLSQRELADRAGVDFSYISKIENGRIPPPAADTVVKLCEIIGVQPENLLSQIGKMPSDVQKTVSSSAAAQEFLREAQRIGLTDDEWRALSQELRGLRRDQ
ncbi:MAG: helix-turn-helix transcriptional regulator [Armatimonadetes bacterium]|nr:helix-turn-helix transcriptional regulator [Armatimonadota bacterium]MDE2205820.1 helix-turn-helix transcriptional regulator [Armatimonadota bacterium]